jgi:serine/threonine protein kinase
LSIFSFRHSTTSAQIPFIGGGGNPVPEASVRAKVRGSAAPGDDDALLTGFTDLVEKMLTIDAGKRPGATQLLAHPVFASL